MVDPLLPSDVDVVIVGGGINGACICNELTSAGYRVLLVDRGDFASGTSAGSTMMIWGGLLYLKDWELRTVVRLSTSRDRLIARYPALVRPRQIRYIPVAGGRSRLFVQSVLYAYWLLGGARRHRPAFARNFSERRLLKHDTPGALTYEEASLEASDARFVLSWILDAAARGAVARNYCALESAAFSATHRRWDVRLADARTGRTHRVTARLVVNAAGAWTDAIDRRAGIRSRYRHVLSRGVSIAVRRDPRHERHLAFDNGVGGNAMAFVPWGPVSLWGSTDTIIDDLDRAWSIERDDLDFLLRQLNRHLARRIGPDDVISLRCGVRAIAVRTGERIDRGASNLSRRHRIQTDRDRPWISIYGGKLSGCTSLASEVRRAVTHRLGFVAEQRIPTDPPLLPHAPGLVRFPALDEPVVPATWSAALEHCRTIEDYLRRRTNIAQWVPRGGLGRDLEHLHEIQTIATTLHGGHAAAARDDVERYRARVDRDWNVLREVSA